MLNHWWRTSWLLAGAGALVAIPARACPPEESGSIAPSSFPAFGLLQSGVGEEPSSITMVMTQRADGHDVSVRIQDGKTSAEIDGKPVPAERVRQSGGKIEVLDEHGDAVATFDTAVISAPAIPAPPAPAGTLRHRMRVSGLANARPLDPTTTTISPFGGQGASTLAFSAGGEPPKVMLGITMSASDSGDRVVVDHVLPGLPAEKAGLKDGDVIVLLDGEKVEDQASVRSTLRAKKPGDTIRLTIDRDGKSQEVAITLEAFDASKLGSAMSPSWRGFDRKLDDKSLQQFDEARERIDRAMEELKKAAAAGKAGAAEHAMEVLAQARKSLDEARVRAETRLREAENASRDLAQDWLAGRRGLMGPAGTLYETQGSTGPSDDMAKRLDEMAKRLEDMNKRLEARESSKNATDDAEARIRKMEARIKELEAQLEKERGAKERR